MTIPLCKLQTFKVKALQFVTHCFMRQEKFGAAEVAGKFTIYVASSKVASNAQIVTTSSKHFGAAIYLFSKKIVVRIQRWSRIRTLELHTSTQGTNFKIEHEIWVTNCVCPSFSCSSILSQFQPPGNRLRSEFLKKTCYLKKEGTSYCSCFSLVGELWCTGNDHSPERYSRTKKRF